MATDIKTQLGASAPLLSVGITSADIMHLAGAVADVEAAGIHLLHFDVMDGNFCPQLTAGPFFIRGIVTKLYKDVHLMVDNPVALIPEFVKAGADIITVHVESGRNVHHALQLIGGLTNANNPARRVLRGIAINPGTPVGAITPFLDEADIVCVLAVNPGFPGGFISSTLRRFEELRKLISDTKNAPLLCIDGGITADTIASAAGTGADIIVSGSAVFKNSRIRENCAHLTSLMNEKRK